MKKLPIIPNKRKINKFRSSSNIKNIKPVTYYKYEEIPSNISQLFFNDQSISQSTFPTNMKNANSSSIPIDHRYYSTINITKKFPLNRNINISSMLAKNYSAGPINIQNNKVFKNKKGKDINENFKKLYENVFKNKKNFIKMQNVEDHMKKVKEKMKKTKFKLYKIIINNQRTSCRSFERKNNHFNDRLHNYLKSNSFYEKNKKYHRNFHFSKNDLNLCHDFTKHYIEPNNPEKNTKLTSNLVLKLLNEEDKKMIYSDPYFFLKDNKYLYKLTNTKFKTLLYRLKEEEEKLEQKKNNNKDNNNDSDSNSTENKNTVLNLNDNLKFEKEEKEENIELKKINLKQCDYISKKIKRNKTMDDGIVLYNKKYINKIINEDLNKRLKEKKIDRNEKVEKEMIKTVTKLNTYKKKDYIFERNNKYYKTYNEKTKENYFKPYILKRNNERLIREQQFHKQRNKESKNNNEEQNIIIKYQKILEDVYRKPKEENTNSI